jgi:hypothetical protein
MKYFFVTERTVNNNDREFSCWNDHPIREVGSMDHKLWLFNKVTTVIADMNSFQSELNSTLIPCLRQRFR